MSDISAAHEAFQWGTDVRGDTVMTAHQKFAATQMPFNASRLSKFMQMKLYYA